MVVSNNMMKSPFDNIDTAFDPMYDEDIWVQRKDGQQTTLQAAVFTDNTALPISDEMMDTDCEQINVLVRKCDWPFIKALVRGDTLKRDGRKYTVQEVVTDGAMGLIVKARSS